jgi:hypothetical protein
MGMRKLLLIFISLYWFAALGQTPLTFLAKKATAAGNAYPTFVSETQTVFNTVTTPKTTASISVNNGDIIVACGVIEGQASSTSDSINVSGGSLTWTKNQWVKVANNTYVLVASTTATSTTSITVSFTHVGNTASLWFGGSAFVFRDSNGIGASNKTNSTGAPSMTLTTTQTNSAIVYVSGDWAAADGTTPLRTWRTINSVTPTIGNGLERAYFRDASHYALYIGYWSDVGGAGSKTVGLSAPGSETYSIAAIEVKGN